MTDEGVKEEIVVIGAKLISKLNHPIELSYNGAAMMLPPRGTCKVLNKDLIGAIPKGVVLIVNS